MADLGKVPYELSIWEDTVFDDNGQTLPYYREKKIAVIGSSTMDTPIRAFDGEFVEGVNGSKELKFKMYYKYNDGDGLVDNPFVPFMVNERKVKLLYDGEWFEFFIKNIQENSSTYTFTYTAKDSNIIELSKGGFNLEFDSKLNNNQGTATELGQRIMEPTSWQVIDENYTIDGSTIRNNIVDDLGNEVVSDCIIQQISENLYEYKVNVASIYAYSVVDSRQTGTVVASTPTLINFRGASDKIYVFYSEATEAGKTEIHFLYRTQDSNYATDTDRNIVNAQYFILKSYNGNNVSVTPSVTVPNAYDINYGNGIAFIAFQVSESYKGEKFIISAKTKYDPLLDKYVTIYTDPDDSKDVNVYTEVEYVTPETLDNFVTNYKEFGSISGWKGGFLGTSVSQKAEASVVSAPDLLAILADRTTPMDDNYTPLVKFKFNGAQSVGFNSGPYDNRLTVKTYSEGEKYQFIIRSSDLLSLEMSSSASSVTVPNTLAITIKVATYTINSDGGYVLDTTLLTFSNLTKMSNGRYCIGEATCEASLTEAEVKNKKIGIFFCPQIASTRYLYVEEAWLYKKSGNVCPVEDNDYEIAINVRYRGYKPVDNQGAVDPEEIIECCNAADEDLFAGYGYVLQQNENSQKILSIKGKESNYFNLLQSVCETFQCWARFTVLHNSDGSVKIEEYPAGSGNYRKCRYITLHRFIGQDNYAGFRYGVNLNSIDRTLASDSIVTKLVVKANKNKYGKDGFCTVARASMNPNNQNSLYNFTHYINSGLIDEDVLYDDLWDSSTGYFTILRAQSKIYDNCTRKIENINETLYPLNTIIETAKAGQMSAGQEILDLEELFYETFHCHYEDFLKGMGANVTIVDSGHLTAWSIFNNQDKTWNGQTAHGPGPTEQRQAKSRIMEMATLKEAYREYSAILDETDPNSEISKFNGYKEEIETLDAQRQTCVAVIEAADKAFYNKYHSFIKEGSWISEEYVDDNKYYLDGLNTLYKAAFPKVSYSIKVIDLASLEEYRGYKARIADKTYIEDTEFFGYVLIDGVKTPYQEQIVITEIRRSLDDPSKNTITVKNYKDEFQDLFHRITATVQSAKFSEGAYDRAADIINSDGTLDIAYLRESFERNAIAVKNAANESVELNEQGLISTNTKNPNNIVRLLSGGIYMSDDGGESWTLGISPTYGINTKLLNAGQINTSIIQIMDKDNPAFRWDKLGISAYEMSMLGANALRYDYTKGVRFDKYGVYGFDGIDSANWDPQDVDDIVGANGVKFALTWKGFNFKHGNSNNLINIGDLGSGVYGIEIKYNGATALKVDNNGNATFNGSGTFGGAITAESGAIGGWTLNSINAASHPGALYFGGFDSYDDEGFLDPSATGSSKCISIGSNFYVTAEGVVYANGGQFSGEITATSGTIGDCIISNGSLIIDNANITSLALTKITSDSSDYVTIDANLYCPRINVNGGTIAGWTIDGSKIYKGLSSVTGSSTGICLQGGGTPGLGIYRNSTNYFRFSTSSGLRIQSGSGSEQFSFENGYLGAQRIRVKELYSYSSYFSQGSKILGIGEGSSGDRVVLYGHSIIPPSNHSKYLGTADRFWTAVFADTFSGINFDQQSDMRLKTNIEKVSDNYLKLFEDIEIKTYEFISETSHRTHIGVIAQEVTGALMKNGFNAKKFAGVTYNEESDKYFVSYSDISMLHLAHYKKFLNNYEKEIDELKNEIRELKAQLQNLQNR